MPQPNLFWTIGQLLVNKKVDLPDNWNYYMVNRYYSMSPDKRIAKVAYYMDMHIYSLREDPKYLALLYKMMLPTLEKAPFIKYIYGVKESDESKKFKFILERMQEYYGWTKEELNKNLPTILHELKDKRTVEQVLLSMGATDKERKSLGIKKMSAALKPQVSSELNQWM